MSKNKQQCSKLIDQRGGSGYAVSRNCSLAPVYVDPFGRPWCKRHAPDEETRERWEAIAAVRAFAKVKP